MPNPSPYRVPPITDGRDLINKTLQQLHKEGELIMGDFDNLAAEMKRRELRQQTVRARATSNDALAAWERYEHLPVNPASAGLFDQIEQDAFTTGYDLGRDAVATQLRIANLQAERDRLERYLDANGIDRNGNSQVVIQYDTLTAEIREGLGL